jgi:hypothetical protein
MARAPRFKIATAYREAVLATGPVGYWRLGEKSGTVARDEMGLNDATLYGTAAFGATGLLTGDSDAAAVFDGGGGTIYGDVPPDLSGTNPFALAVWVDLTADATDRGILSVLVAAGYGADISYEATRVYIRRANVDGQDYTAGSTALAAGRHMLVGSYDGTNLRFYTDATINGAVTASSRVLPALARVNIGGYYAGASSPIGSSDEPALWSRAITPGEIAELYRIGMGR